MASQGSLLLALAAILLAGIVGGQLAHKVRLPHVTGQILIGVLIGQLGLSFLGPEQVHELSVVTDFALGLIALNVGENLNLRTLRNAGKRLFFLLLTEATLVPALVFGVGYLVYGAPWLPLLLAAMAISTAPATVIALIKEHRAKGVFVKTLSAAVALNNIACIVLFAVARTLANAGMGQSGGGSTLDLLITPLYQIAIAVLLGAASGVVLVLFTRRLGRSDRLAAASVVALLLVVGASLYLDVSLLLSSLVLGFVLTNLTPEQSELGGTAFENLETAIFAAFFTMAGMELHFTQLGTAGILVLAVFGARFAGKLLSARVAMHLAAGTDTVRRYLGLGLIPQAGVAVGFILLVQQDPALEPIHQLILEVGLTTVMLNELIGSVTANYALKRSGDVGKDRPRLIDFIGEHNITTDIQASTKEAAIEKLTDVLIQSNALNVDREQLLRTFFDREHEASTCVGAGLAIPHGILPDGDRMYGVMGISREGMPLETPDGKPVHCMVLLATPESQRERHVEVIAALARAIGRDRTIQEQLFNARTPAHVYDLLHAEESEGFNYYLENR
jgi:Kef-type K+ transport system membrane component KefB/mannitol/fructose-specific phosphotransferase system IIA component